MCLHEVFTIVTYVCTLKGPPGDIIDLTILSDTITACSFALQWSRPSSDPYVCTIRIKLK